MWCSGGSSECTSLNCATSLNEHLWDSPPLPSTIFMDVISDLTTGTCKVPDKVISPDLAELLAGESEQSSNRAKSLGKSQSACWWMNLFFIKLTIRLQMSHTTVIKSKELQIGDFFRPRMRQRTWCVIYILRVNWVVFKRPASWIDLSWVHLCVYIQKCFCSGVADVCFKLDLNIWSSACLPQSDLSTDAAANLVQLLVWCTMLYREAPHGTYLLSFTDRGACLRAASHVIYRCTYAWDNVDFLSHLFFFFFARWQKRVAEL